MMTSQSVSDSRRGAPLRRSTALPALALALSAAVLAAGCNRNEPTADPVGQTAARVDGKEISVHQINYLLSRANTGADNPEAAKALRRQVLEKLVDQQLLVQKAQDDKLDRTPDGQMALETARREALANAYLQQFSVNKAKPSDADIRKYYLEHPELFSQRRIFEMQELTFSAKTPVETLTAVTSRTEAGASLDEMTQFLNTRGVTFGRTDSQRASEQITLDLLPRLARMKPGQALVVNGPQTVSLVYLKSFQEAPIPEAASLPRVAQFLSNQALNQTLGDVIRSLRSKARIEYVGEFSEADPAVRK